MTKHTLNPILAYEPISPKSPEPLQKCNKRRIIKIKGRDENEKIINNVTDLIHDGLWRGCAVNLL